MLEMGLGPAFNRLCWIVLGVASAIAALALWRYEAGPFIRP